MIRVDLPRFARFDAWRRAARQLASAGIPAAEIHWATAGEAPDLFGAAPMPPAGGIEIVATKSFLDLAETVASHSDPARFSLLYKALLLLQKNRGLLDNPADPLVHRLKALAKSVRRDIHKMHAFLRFHELAAEGPRRAFVAWFEPEHPILEAGSRFFVKRFFDMDWVIATPEGVARFDGNLRFTDPIPKPDLPEDESHALWQTYFANIFNPARVKTQAMRSEMPLKYWKNLPETRLIPDMLADAERRVRAMAEAGASEAPSFAAKVTARTRDRHERGAPEGLALAAKEAATCARCELCHAASRTVWGEGRQDAPLMIVGEAPGDQEDLQGRVFIGPAGQLLREVMGEVGLDPAQCWMTNAVKHFKFTPRGQRRLHQSPKRGEIEQCRWWLGLERRFIRPELTLALGATAAFALTGDQSPLSARRGQIESDRDGGPVLITWHPSLILRLPAEEARAAKRDLQEDLARAAAMVALAKTT